MNKINKCLMAFAVVCFFSFPLVAQQNLAQQNLFGNVKSALWPTPQDRAEFYEAVKKGDISLVKRMVEAFPLAPLMTDFVQDKNKKGVFPICVAVENGHDELLKYMVKTRPELLRVTCKNKETPLFWTAVENKQWNTATLLISLKAPLGSNVFTETAMKIKDEIGLKKILPVLLKEGKDPSSLLFVDAGKKADVFYIAALHQNAHFVTVLRDEIKGAKKEVISRFEFLECPDHYALAYGANRKTLENERAERIKERENSPEANFLKSRGVPLHVSVQFKDGAECE